MYIIVTQVLAHVPVHKKKFIHTYFCTYVPHNWAVSSSRGYCYREGEENPALCDAVKRVLQRGGGQTSLWWLYDVISHGPWSVNCTVGSGRGGTTLLPWTSTAWGPRAASASPVCKESTWPRNAVACGFESTPVLSHSLPWAASALHCAHHVQQHGGWCTVAVEQASSISCAVGAGLHPTPTPAAFGAGHRPASSSCLSVFSSCPQDASEGPEEWKVSPLINNVSPPYTAVCTLLPHTPLHLCTCICAYVHMYVP